MSGGQWVYWGPMAQVWVCAGRQEARAGTWVQARASGSRPILRVAAGPDSAEGALGRGAAEAGGS